MKKPKLKNKLNELSKDTELASGKDRIKACVFLTPSQKFRLLPLPFIAAVALSPSLARPHLPATIYVSPGYFQVMEAKALIQLQQKQMQHPLHAGLRSLSCCASRDAHDTTLMDPLYLGFSNWVCSGGQRRRNGTGEHPTFP